MLGLFLQWYFFEIPSKIKKIWGNYLWFFARLFAIGKMFREFFAPWKGLALKREKRAFELGDAFSALLGNIFLSMIGAVARLLFIIIGLAVELLALMAGIFAYAAWLLFIPAIFYCLVKGLALLV